MERELTELIEATLPHAICGTKWNAVNFSYNGRDIITFNSRPGRNFCVIFHCGATFKDSKTGTTLVPLTRDNLRWATDHRAILEIAGDRLTDELKHWLAAFIVRWAEAADRLGCTAD